MRVKSWIVGLLAVVATSLTACKPVTLRADPAAEAIANAIYADTAAGRIAAVQARLTPEAAAVVTPAQILALRAYTEPQSPTARRLIGLSTFNSMKGPETQNLAYELTYPGKTVLYQITLQRPTATAAWGVETVNLNRATDAELARSGFTLSGRSLAQLSFLAATILSPLLMLTAIILVVRATGLKRKWLWALLALVGIGSATMNWTTGEANFQPITAMIIGAGVVKQGASNFFPWILKFTLPIGAVIALWRVAKARRDAKAALDAGIAGF